MTVPRSFAVAAEKSAGVIRGILYLLILMLPYSSAVVESCVGTGVAVWLFKGSVELWHRRKDAPQGSWIHQFGSSFRPAPTPLDIPVLVFSLWCLLSAAFSMEPAQSFYSFFTKTFEWFVVFYLTKEVMTERRYLLVFLGVFLTTTTMVLVDGLLQYYVTHQDLIRGVVFDGMRMSASFKHPNFLGAYLAFVVPTLAAVLFWRGRPWYVRMLAVGMVALSGWCLFLTFSRAAWLATGIGLLICFCHRRFLKHGLVISVVLTIGLCCLIPRMQDTMRASFEIRHESMSYRVNVWKDSWKMIRQRPVFGFGPNTYMKYFQEYRRKKDGNASYDPTYAHNSLVQIAVETGLPGMLAFLWVIGALLGHNVRGWLVRPDTSDICSVMARGMGCGLIVFFLHSLLDTNFFSLQLAVFFWVMAGVFVSMPLISRPIATAR